MAARRSIGLIYEYNENWIGGTYYIENLVKALNLLPDNRKPILKVFINQHEDFNKLRKITKYPYLVNAKRLVRLLPVRAINKLAKIFTGRKLINIKVDNNIDVMFPAQKVHFYKNTVKSLYWIPDFQEHFLPQFFTDSDISSRKELQNWIVENCKYIVFSSRSALKNFNTIYPHQKLKCFVLPFAVTHPIVSLNYDVVEKYQLPSKFFICSNQFWAHKNHKIILQALHQLKTQGHNLMVAFTGKPNDHRDPDFYDRLNEMVVQYNVEDCVSFLGFISREDQLSLIKKSLAVIQPSLFEGWSTVIEDSKSIGASIIASNFEVHLEQLQNYQNKVFFDPNNPIQLASLLIQLISTNTTGSGINYDYQADVTTFGSSFSSIIDELISYP